MWDLLLHIHSFVCRFETLFFPFPLPFPPSFLFLSFSLFSKVSLSLKASFSIGKYLGYTSVNGIVQLVIFWTLGLLYLISYSRGALGDPGSVPKFCFWIWGSCFFGVVMLSISHLFYFCPVFFSFLFFSFLFFSFPSQRMERWTNRRLLPR